MLVDSVNRCITYLRVSVTDRCDFRCVYCMDENAVFRPRSEILSLEELDRLCSAFVTLGVRKLRLSGGEPLVRRNVIGLIRRLGRHLDNGALDELTLTTNGSRLAENAADLFAAGVRRINVSLDTLDPRVFARVTRGGDFGRVVAGIEAARAVGLHVRINTVAMKGVNDDGFDRMIAWCGERGFDVTLIETMPLGRADGRDDRFVSLADVAANLARRWTLVGSVHQTGGPAHYVRIAETGRYLGFITPLSRAFCEGCNRVRLTCNGRLVLCLGQEDSADLSPVLRSGVDDAGLMAAISAAVSRKPAGHDFLSRRIGPERAMNVTGG